MPLLASSLALRARLGALKNLGVDTRDVCARAEIAEASLANPHHFVPESTIWAMWRAASMQTGVASLGLRAGASVPFGAYGVLDYLSRKARTLGKSLEHTMRYWPLIGTGKRVEIVSEGGFHRVRYIPNAPAAGGALQCRDYTLTVMTSHLFERSGRRPVAVEFAGRPIAPLREYGELLGTRALFQQEHTALVYADRDWNAELPWRDAQLVDRFEAYAEKLMEQLPQDRGIVALAARQISERLRDGDLGLCAIAASLSLGERRLQRHLSQEGYTFEGLVDAVRLEAATELLKDPGLSVTEIGYLLGYAGPAAFHRAYKRWTGTSPRSAARKPSQ